MKSIALVFSIIIVSTLAYAQDQQAPTQNQPVATPETQPTPQVVPAVVAPPAVKPLRKREFALIYDFKSVTTQVEISTAKSKTTTSEGRIQFLRNNGYFEFGAVASFYRVKNEETSAESTSGNVAAIGHLNIIENTPGNDVIPYLAVGFGNLGITVANVDFQGAILSTGAGLKWYPFSELFALTAEVSFASGTLSGNSVTANLRQSGLLIGWGIWF